jgi:hypothetical protein
MMQTYQHHKKSTCTCTQTSSKCHSAAAAAANKQINVCQFYTEQNTVTTDTIINTYNSSATNCEKYFIEKVTACLHWNTAAVCKTCFFIQN